MFVYFCKPLDSYTNNIHARSASEKKKKIHIKASYFLTKGPECSRAAVAQNFQQ